jgi:predicted signal transduction protein with EAL and GGDEF domain
VSLRDASVLIVLTLVLFFVRIEFDIYKERGRCYEKHEEPIELNEALSIAAILCIGQLELSFRRYNEQRRETRRIAAEQHAGEMAFENPLTGLPNRRHIDDALRPRLERLPERVRFMRCFCSI